MEILNTVNTGNILVNAGLSFEVEKNPLYIKRFNRDGDSFDVSDMSSGIFRTDTGQQIGAVGPGYEPLQNAEILRPFLEATKEGYLQFKSGSAIDNGRRFQLTFETGEDISIHGDILKRRIIVGSSHDGSWSTFIKSFVYRQICSNGLMGFGLKDSFKVRHTTNIKAGYAMALKQLGETEAFFRGAFDRYSHLFDVHLDYAQMKRLTDTLLDIDETDPKKETSTRKKTSVKIFFTCRNMEKGFAATAIS